MKYVLLLTFLFTCNEPKPKFCMLIIPDSIPIQFWLNGVPSFNEQTHAGVLNKCFTQLWQCTDDIRIQVTSDEEGQALNLVVKDIDGNILATLPFIPTVKTRLVAIYPALQFSNTDFAANITGWNNYSGSDRGAFQTFAYSSGSAVANASASHAKNTVYFATPRTGSPYGWPPGDYVLTIRAKNNSGGLPDAFGVSAYGMPDSSHQTFLANGSANFPNDNTYYTRTITFTTTQYWANLAVAFDHQGGPGTFDILANISDLSITSAPTNDVVYSKTIMNVSTTPEDDGYCEKFAKFEIQDDSDDSVIARSDYMWVSEVQPDTRMIDVSNKAEYDNVDYSGDLVLSIRVESKFFKQRSPEVNESEEESDGTEVKLSSSTKDQKYFQAHTAPYYFHEKLKLMLQLNTVLIDGVYWVKEETYEYVDIGGDSYPENPLKLGNTWLTKANSIRTNVYGASITI